VVANDSVLTAIQIVVRQMLVMATLGVLTVAAPTMSQLDITDAVLCILCSLYFFHVWYEFHVVFWLCLSSLMYLVCDNKTHRTDTGRVKIRE